MCLKTGLETEALKKKLRAVGTDVETGVKMGNAMLRGDRNAVAGKRTKITYSKRAKGCKNQDKSAKWKARKKEQFVS